ncbi:MAG: hypothetical protein ACXVLQ_14265 [Bacteriovorax sp.]
MKNTIRNSLSVLAVFGSVSFMAESALAELITHNFTGAVTSSTGPVFGRSYSVGEQVKGSFTYDTGLPPYYSDLTLSAYVQSPPSGMTLNIAGVTIKSQNHNEFQVFDNNWYYHDCLNGYSSPVIVEGELQSGAIRFDLIDHTDTALSNKVLQSSINLLSFDSRSGRIDDYTNGAVVNFSVISVTPAPVEVNIDIKPGTFPNSINPKNQGKIPVAILTTSSFNAASVIPNTVHFGSMGTEAAPVQYAMEDVDGDGDLDLILHFNTQDTGIKCGDTSATLTGKTIDGKDITGTDSIVTVGCK